MSNFSSRSAALVVSRASRNAGQNPRPLPIGGLPNNLAAQQIGLKGMLALMIGQVDSLVLALDAYVCEVDLHGGLTNDRARVADILSDVTRIRVRAQQVIESATASMFANENEHS